MGVQERQTARDDIKLQERNAHREKTKHREHQTDQPSPGMDGSGLGGRTPCARLYFHQLTKIQRIFSYESDYSDKAVKH